MRLQVVARRPEVIEGRLRGNEPELHQPARGVIHEGQQRAHLATVLEPCVFGAVDLHQLAQTIAPPARLMRRGQAVPPIGPQTVRDHPAAQRLARNRTTVMFSKLLGGERWTKIRVAFADQRQRQDANLGWTPIVARLATALRQQTRGTVLFEPSQKPEDLPPSQANQRARVSDAETARLNLYKHLKPAEFLLAH